MHETAAPADLSPFITSKENAMPCIYLRRYAKTKPAYTSKGGLLHHRFDSRILTRIITRRVIVSAILPIKFNRVAYIIIVVSERGTYI